MDVRHSAYRETVGGIMKKSVAVASVVLLTIGFALLPISADAADSVRVSGDIPTEQCPVGYQYSRGIEVNATTHEQFTICNAPPNADDQLRIQQDQDFQARIQAAQSAAEIESRRWNAANPGLQKCVQWGPVVHANGVSTSSGGVCANPVSANDATVPEQSADAVTGELPVVPIDSRRQPSGSPYYVEVPGQVGVEGCPVGFQGANGLVTNATTGQTTTQCWAKDAWDAWRLGGDVWQQFQSSGGTYDVAAEIDRRNKVADLKARALAVANAAAAFTPGVKRCSSWTGYGETGKECAYSFIDPDSQTNGGAVQASDSVLRNAESMPVAEATQLTTAASLKFVAPKGKKLTLKTLTPSVCKISNSKVISRKAGTCRVQYITTSAAGKVSKTTKSVIFVK